MSSRRYFLQVINNGLQERGTPIDPSLDEAVRTSGPLIRLLNRTGGREEAEPVRMSFPDRVLVAALPPDGTPSERSNLLAVGCRDGSLHLREVDTGRPVRVAGRELSFRFDGACSIQSLAWHPDGRLAIGGSSVVAVWEPFREERPTIVAYDYARKILWLSDGLLMVEGAEGARTLERFYSLLGPSPLSRPRRLPAEKGLDRLDMGLVCPEPQRWDPGADSQALYLHIHDSAIEVSPRPIDDETRFATARARAAAFLPDGRLAFSSRALDDGRRISVLDARGVVSGWEALCEKRVRSLVPRGESLVFSADDEGELCLWDLDKPAIPLWRNVATRHRRGDPAVACHPSGRAATAHVQGVRKGWVELWDTTTSSECIQRWVASEAPVRAFAWRSDGLYLATASLFEGPKGWDLRDQARLTWTGAAWSAGIPLLAWGPEGFLASACSKGLEVFAACEAPSGREAEPCDPVWRSHTTGVTPVALDWHPDGSLIALGTSDGSLCLFDARNGKRLSQHVIRTGGIRALRWAPDGRVIRVADDGRETGRPRLHTFDFIP